MRYSVWTLAGCLLLLALGGTNTATINSTFKEIHSDETAIVATVPSDVTNLIAQPSATPTIIAPPTALPRTLGKNPLYVLDVLNGRLVSELIGMDADTGQTVSSLTLRYAPDIHFSPDGEHLYVLDSYFTRVTHGDWRDVLTVFDANSLELERDDVPVSDRVKYKVFPIGNRWFFSSEDGKYLFVGKYGKPNVHQLRLAVLDAATFEQIAEYPMPGCSDGHVTVLRAKRLVCQIGNALMAIAPLSGETTPLIELPGIGTPLTFGSAKHNRWYRVDRAGRVTVIDLAASPPRVVVENVQLELPAEHTPGWLEQVILSGDGARLYLGLTPTKGELFGTGMADLIRVFDTQTWNMLGEIKPMDPPRYLALSNDGTQLYMTSPEKQTLTIYDTRNFRESRVIHDLGISPSQILIPPEK